MKRIVVLAIAVLLILFGLTGVLWPAGLMSVAKWTFSPTGLYTGAGLRLFIGALRGTHLDMRGVSSAKVQDFSLRFPAPPSMEMDGELRTARSATVRIQCVPLALWVLAAPGAVW